MGHLGISFSNYRISKTKNLKGVKEEKITLSIEKQRQELHPHSLQKACKKEENEVKHLSAEREKRKTTNENSVFFDIILQQ